MFNKIHYRIEDNNNQIVASTFSEDEIDIINYIHLENQIIEYKNKKYRAGVIVNKNRKIYAISSSKDIIKSSKTFKTFLNILKDFSIELYKFKSLISDTISKQFDILVHNLVSINAHNIQEIYNIIPQNELSNSIRDKKKFIRNKINSNLDKTAIALLKIMKNNNAIKSEFSVYKKLFEKNPQLNFKNHNIHRVLMNIFYSFFPDFTDKNIYVDVKPSQLKAFFDYESIHVAFFHILENATKYIQPNSNFNIFFEDLLDEVKIIFSMNSLIIESEEIDLIFNEGYSGNLAKKLDKDGHGIGMSRVRRIIELNNGNIQVQIGDRIDDLYQENKFIISLKKEGYIR